MVNVGPVLTQLNRVSTAAFIAAARGESACSGEAIGKRFPVKHKVALNEHGQFDIPLDGFRGLMCAQLEADGRGAPGGGASAQAWVQVSNLSATVKTINGGVLVWVTHLDDASPAAKA